MEKNIFISHSSYDREIVKIFSELIKKVSLRQLNIWFSNDTDTDGGFLAGDDWFESIINHIKRSQVVISFITPNSNNQPWILYESGYADALNNCTLVPVKFSIDISDISIPLQHKQIYNLSGIENMHIFLSKLLNLFNIIYDKEVFQEIVEIHLKKMRDCFGINSLITQNTNIENRIVSRLEQKLEYYLGGDKKGYKLFGYDKHEIKFIYKANDIEKSEYLTINEKMVVEEVLDEIYRIISDFVSPYTYLESWVLTEVRTQRMAIISRDIQDWIPAKDIFKANTIWEVEFLKEPLVRK